MLAPATEGSWCGRTGKSRSRCEAVASVVRGALALPHAYGRLQFGKDLELFFRTLIGIGSLQKIGRRTRFIDVLEPAQPPGRGAGLYFMDTSSAGAECVTLQAAAGFEVHLFPTGQGNVIGNPIEPVIKLTANPQTARTMGGHIDLDVSGILRRELTAEGAANRLIEIMLRTCSGRLTAAEALGHREFVLTRLHRSA